jgi:hypothetical protein
MPTESNHLKLGQQDAVEKVIKDLSNIIEDEVKAFQLLLETLLEQQASILRGDALSVSKSNNEVERLVAETKKLEKERRGISQDLSRCFELQCELTLTQIIPVVEERYAARLKELKDIIHVLSEKIQSTNRRNRYLLEHSLQFVNNCMRILSETRTIKIAYNREGLSQKKETSLYQGIG